MAEEREEHELVPVAFWFGSVPIPDLAKLPEDRWEPVLRQIPYAARGKAIHTAPWGRFGDVARVTAAIDMEEARRKRVGRDMVAFPPPLPGAAGSVPTPRKGRQRQVAFRLYHVQHEALETAAERLGLKPAQLARLLTLRGVSQVLAEDA